MKPARWGMSLPFATLGAEYGRIVAHVFTDDSTAPICLPRVAGSPGAITSSDRAWHCEACQGLLVRAWWSVTSFGKQRLWTANASDLMAAKVEAGAPLHEAGKPAASGFASDDLDALNQARAAIESLLPADAPTLFSRSSDADAERLARERRAEERALKISDGTGAQVVEYVYRHHKRWRSWTDTSFIWETETARVLRKTAKRLFVQDTIGTYTTAGGVMVLKCYALDREALQRGTHRWGWTLNAHPPAEGFTSTPGWATELGVELPTTLAEAKRAFRRKAKVAHPDSGGTPEAFRRVTEAFNAASQHFGGGR